MINSGTGKSFSEALIVASVNPQHDERLFNEFQETYKLTTRCVQILFWMSKQKKNTIFVHNVLPLLENSMNNLLSCCGLTDARMEASEKDLPVTNVLIQSGYLKKRCLG